MYQITAKVNAVFGFFIASYTILAINDAAFGASHIRCERSVCVSLRTEHHIKEAFLAILVSLSQTLPYCQHDTPSIRSPLDGS